MRVGLLTRFWGSLGMALGVAALLLLVQFCLIFFIYFGLLLIGKLPAGDHPRGRREKPSHGRRPGERMAKEIEPKDGGPDPDGTPSAVEAPGLGPPSRRRSPRKPRNPTAKARPPAVRRRRSAASQAQAPRLKRALRVGPPRFVAAGGSPSCVLGVSDTALAGCGRVRDAQDVRFREGDGTGAGGGRTYAEGPRERSHTCHGSVRKMSGTSRHRAPSVCFRARNQGPKRAVDFGPLSPELVQR